ncbi:ethanolamine ammonia-lyase reactivating factor EutA [Paenibacillus caui]|uniref:ethanolamine ammonia-lyase reactivating factor EutA n=1 Tax=Paenibacillus caui TaxID=2873927 RepID=UPI001CA9B92B
MTTAASEEWITSLGIDLGTSTTKLIVSRLQIKRTANAFSMPKAAIAKRTLVYCSGIYTTPLLGDNELDYPAIADILEREYRLAGISFDEVKSGAVIITGETANKRNAAKVLHQLAERAGDFVVATAGADLEGVLAGKGSGAEARSLEIKGTVLSVDIGGGTANAAFFRQGACIATITFRIGGRLIMLDNEGTITAVAGSFLPWLKANGWDLHSGSRLKLEDYREITDRMAESLLSCLAGRGSGESDALLLVGERPAVLPAADELMLSGGVAALTEEAEPTRLEEAARFGDIGPLLAGSVMRAAAAGGFRQVAARQTVRATVIGAGMHSTEIAGATVHIPPGVLPLRNVPVVKAELPPAVMDDEGRLNEAVVQAMASAKALHSAEEQAPFALFLDGPGHCTYAGLQRLADSISRGWSAHFPQQAVAVVVCRTDMAKALGQALQRRVAERVRVVCIDQVGAEHGDYIDLGEPVGGTLVPVVVKTLAFSRPPGG